jgi:phosphate:Na+ symporter
MTDDARVARQLAEEKVTFRRAEHDAVAAHFDVMRADRLKEGMQSAIHLDLLRDMKLINSHIVAAAAYPVLDRAGVLLPTRIAAPG